MGLNHSRESYMTPTRILILGAAGRDFHVFNSRYRGNPEVEVVGFTAQQIPNIEDRRYPAAIAGEDLYPDGIQIHPEDELERLIGELRVERCVMAYSDVSHEYVGHLASRVNAAGADFELPDSTVQAAGRGDLRGAYGSGEEPDEPGRGQRPSGGGPQGGGGKAPDALR